MFWACCKILELIGVSIDGKVVYPLIYLEWKNTQLFFDNDNVNIVISKYELKPCVAKLASLILHWVAEHT